MVPKTKAASVASHDPATGAWAGGAEGRLRRPVPLPVAQRARPPEGGGVREGLGGGGRSGK